MKKFFVFCCFCVVFINQVFCQSQPPIKQFWKEVAFRYQYKELSAGMRSWLHSMAEEESKSYTGAMALLENLINETAFQNKMIRTIYVGNQNRENLRMILGAMCGKFSLGNEVADYFTAKYAQDPNVQKEIAKRSEVQKKEKMIEEKKKQEYAKKEEMKKIKEKKESEDDKIEEQALLEQEQKTENSLAQTYKTRLFNEEEIDTKIQALNPDEINSQIVKNINNLLNSTKLNDRNKVFSVWGELQLNIDSTGKTIKVDTENVKPHQSGRSYVENITKLIDFNFLYKVRFTIPRYKEVPVNTKSTITIQNFYFVKQDKFISDGEGNITKEEGRYYIPIGKNSSWGLIYKSVNQKGTYRIKYLVKCYPCSEDNNGSYFGDQTFEIVSIIDLKKLKVPLVNSLLNQYIK